jgi:thiamine biosynthesis lipoprotein
MATRIAINVPASARVRGEASSLDSALAAAKQIFHSVDDTCTRFDPSSPLMLANRSPKRWHRVPEPLFRALEEAKRAHDITGGRFDPRVFSVLVALGYDKTLPFGEREVRLDHGGRGISSSKLSPWRPRFRYATSEVVLGELPVDLGGIGKGLAVRWSSQALAKATSDFLIEAGGDCYCSGYAGDGEPWRIGVEDPANRDEPICVLSFHDRAVTTSSIRLRRWAVDGRVVHHLIDPATMKPGGRGLLAVTVVGTDPARSEVWSKALFISGKNRIAELAERRSIAALWIDDAGRLTTSSAIERYVQWRRR